MKKPIEKKKVIPFVAMRVMPICPRCENTWNGYVCHKCNYKPDDEETNYPKN